MKHFIYADNAATTKLDEEVFETMKPYLINYYGNPSQPYSFSRTLKKAIKEAREVIAECIGALPEEIYFTSGGSESDNFAIKGMAFCNYDKKTTITSCIEHHAVLNACRTIERMGYPVVYLPVNHQGEVSGSSLESIITDNTGLVSIMLANNEIGTIEPISQLSQIAHRYGAYFHTDAVQAIGHLPIDVSKLGVDLLSASAHKFNGPKGIGFIYVKKGTRITSLIDGGQQEFGLRAGTENVASIVGMATALKKNCKNIKNNQEYIKNLENCFFNDLNSYKLDYVRNGSCNRLPGNISLSFAEAEGEMILHRLDLKGIYISTGSACDSVNTQISHVIDAIKLDSKYAKGTIRISLGINNTLDETKILAKELSTILKK